MPKPGDMALDGSGRVLLRPNWYSPEDLNLVRRSYEIEIARLRAGQRMMGIRIDEAMALPRPARLRCRRRIRAIFEFFATIE